MPFAAVVEALLRRKMQDEHTESLSHIRSMKDLKEVRVSVVNGKPVCPVTNKELNGKIACYAVFPGRDGEVNVISERAINEMQDIVADYGPIEEKIRLIPPPSVLAEMVEALERKRAESGSRKKAKKDKKKSKRKRDDEGDDVREENSKKSSTGTGSQQQSTIAAISSRSASKKDGALSSLFTTSDKQSSEKERKDNLFVR